MSSKSDSLTPPAYFPLGYDFLGPLGRGGMGVVYKAFDQKRQQEVAIKFLPEEHDDEQLGLRFHREAAQLASLSHPNVVGFYESGTHLERDYLVVEFVSGGNLLDELRRSGGRWTWALAANFFAQVCDGLAHIHNQGYIHRDLKPENILVTKDGTPKITDFGLARNMTDRSRLTTDGAIVGTISYLAPEQIMSGNVGPTADLYALGCCIYATVTGQPVFTGGSELSLLNSHLREIPVPPKNVLADFPAEFDSLINKMLRKQPEERPQSAEEVGKILRQIAAKNIATSSQIKSTLLGRQDVLQQLERYCQLDPNRGFSCLFTGPNGLGRSVVMRQWVAQVRSQGWNVITVAPSPRSPFPLIEAFAQMGKDCKPFVEACVNLGIEAAVDVLVESLVQLDGPWVLVADDFMRMPKTTNLLLNELAKRPPPAGKGWILSCGAARAASLSMWPKASKIDLLPLERQPLMEVARRILGGTPDADLWDYLEKRTAGSVRRLRQNLTALRIQDALESFDDKRQYRLKTQVKLSPNISEVILEDLEKEGSGRFRLLRTSALMQEPFVLKHLVESAGLTEDEADDCVEKLVSQGLLEESWGGKGEFYYISSPEVRQALVQNCSERTRRRIYSKMLDCFDSRLPLSTRAVYEVRAGLELDSLQAVEKACKELKDVGGYAEAADLWGEVFPEFSDCEQPDLRWKVVLNTAEAQVQAGLWEEAQESCQLAIAAAQPQGSAQASFQRCYGLAVYLQVKLRTGDPLSLRELVGQSESAVMDPKAGPQNLYHLLALAIACETLRDHTGLQKVLVELAKLDPVREAAPYDFYRLLSRQLLSVGRPAEALTLLEGKLQPGSSIGCPLNSEERRQVECERVLCLLSLGEWGKARQTLHAQAAVASRGGLGHWEARFHLLMGESYRWTNDQIQALKFFHNASACCPRGGVFEAECLFEGGLQSFRTALSNEKESQAHMAAAEQAWRNCVSSAGPELAGAASFCLALLCYEQSRFEEGREWLGQVKSETLQAWAAVYRAEMMRCQQDFVGCVHFADKVLTDHSGSLASQAAQVLKNRCQGSAVSPVTLQLLRESEPNLTLPKECLLPTGKGAPGWLTDPVRQAWLDLAQNASQSGVRLSGRILHQDSPSQTLKIEQIAPAAAGAPTPETKNASKTLDPVPVAAQPQASSLVTERTSKTPAPAQATPPAAAPSKLPLAIGVGALLLGCTLLLGRPLLGGLVGQGSPSPTRPTDSPSSSASAGPVQVVLDTVPSGADLTLFDPQGHRVTGGKSPLQTEPLTQSGEYLVNASLDGYVDGQFRFQGGSELLNKTFELQKNQGRLRLTLGPVPLTLFINDQHFDVTTPTFEKELAPGKYHLKLSKPDYRTLSRDIQIKGPGLVEPPAARLLRDQGQLELTVSPAPATIFLNGKSVGATDATGHWTSPKIKAQDYKVKVTRENFKTQEFSVLLHPEKKLKKSVELVEIPVVPVSRPEPLPPPRVREPEPRWNPPPAPRPAPVIHRPDDV